MATLQNRTKYYLLGLFFALMVAMVSLLAVAPSAQAQEPGSPPPTIHKQCSPNPVQVGEQLTCTIDVEAVSGTFLSGRLLTDTFPQGVTPTEATVVSPTDPRTQCTVTGKVVTCQLFNQYDTSTVTIQATAEQCGTFTNSATAEGTSVTGPEADFDSPFTVTATERITVACCQGSPQGSPQDNKKPNQGQGTPTPITQDSSQDVESGEASQTFDVT